MKPKKASRLPDEASFLEDVATHEMQILRDEETYRQLRFKRPGTINMYFDVVTWPGFLCYSGDMGCYVFSRLHDMFDFFRHDPSYQSGERLNVNPDYWGQKVQAVDRASPIAEYDPQKFRDRICEWVDNAGWPQSSRKAVCERVLSRADDGEHEAMRAALEFEHEGRRFDNFYECSLREVSYRFLWCCYALAWTVKNYDEHKAEVAPKGSSA